MKRRQFLALGLTTSGAVVVSKVLGGTNAFAKDGKAAKPAAGAKGPSIPKKDVLQEGQPATVANYCNAEKQPNKHCPDYKSKPGRCEKCTFYNTDASKGQSDGIEVAHCQLLNEGPKYVYHNHYCSTYVEKS